MVGQVSGPVEMMYRSYPPNHGSAFSFWPTPLRSRIHNLHSHYEYCRYDTPRASYYASHVSPVSCADEVEAATALISLPSSGNDSSRGNMLRPVHVQSYKPIETSPITFRKIKSIPTCQLTSTSIETTSRNLYSNKTVVSHPSSTDASSVSSNDNSIHNMTERYTGSISLSLPEDDDVLSPLHCYIRRYCVEAFSATPQDVLRPRYGKSHLSKIVAGQIGIRCIHCKHLPLDERPNRAVCYPSSLHNIYHSIETWQRRHSALCTTIPAWIKRDLTRLIRTSRSTAGGPRQYWEDSAKRIGLVDTPQGVHFAQRPYDMDIRLPVPESKSDSQVVSLVSPSERPIVSDYLFLLMEQMEPCQFTEQDRIGGRSKVKDYPIGFRGMQCKHCRGKAGFGRYFPVSVDALALANSDRNIYNHLLKCRKCPEKIQNELQLQHQQAGSKNKRGSRKQFFAKVWERIHSER